MVARNRVTPPWISQRGYRHMSASTATMDCHAVCVYCFSSPNSSLWSISRIRVGSRRPVGSCLLVPVVFDVFHLFLVSRQSSIPPNRGGRLCQEQHLVMCGPPSHHGPVQTFDTFHRRLVRSCLCDITDPVRVASGRTWEWNAQSTIINQFCET